MTRLLIVFFAYYISWHAYDICLALYPADVDKWDLLRHTFFTVPTGCFALLLFVKGDHKYEGLVRLLVAMYIFGVLANDVFDNFTGNRDFNWYDPIFIAIGYFTGGKQADPEMHEKIFTKIIGKPIYNKLCHFLK